MTTDRERFDRLFGDDDMPQLSETDHVWMLTLLGDAVVGILAASAALGHASPKGTATSYDVRGENAALDLDDGIAPDSDSDAARMVIRALVMGEGATRIAVNHPWLVQLMRQRHERFHMTS